MTQTTQVEITICGQQLGAGGPLFPSRQAQLATPEPGNNQPLTLKQLLTQIVDLEVAAFAAHQADRRLSRVLSAEQIAADRQSGRVDPAAKGTRTPADPAAAVQAALQAFVDGLYFVFVDGVQVETLDERVRLNPGSEVKFIRLAALAGG